MNEIMEIDHFSFKKHLILLKNYSLNVKEFLKGLFMLFILLKVIGGLLILYVSSEILIKKTDNIALLLGMRPIIIGLSVITIATSMPEAFTSLVAQLHFKNSNIAIGNIIGSNIANIGLVFSLNLLIHPQGLQKIIIKKDLFLLLLGTFLFGFFMIGNLNLYEGIFLVILYIAILYFQIHSRVKKQIESGEKIKKIKMKKFLSESSVLFVCLITLLMGAYLFINGAEKLALKLNISGRIIALTLVAIGSSLPEISISVLAAIRKNPGVSLGNIIGSNLFNTLFIGGLIAIFSPVVLSDSFLVKDLPVMVFFTIVLLMSSYLRSKVIVRALGAFIFILYLGYLWQLIFSGS
jgi:cation:H+ antiporter